MKDANSAKNVAKRIAQIGMDTLLLRVRREEIMEKTDASLQEEVRFHEKFGEVGIFLVVFGLAGEFVIALKYRHGQSFEEVWYPVIGSLLVYAGVVMELIAHRKGIAKEHELDRRSEEKVAAANERAAKAERETEKIKLLTAWRHVPSGLHETLSSVLGEKAADIDLLVEYQMGDPEAYGYACEILDMFSKAGVTKLRHCSNAHMGSTIFGLFIGPVVFAPAEPTLFLMPIASAFNDAGLQISLYRIDLKTHLPRNFVAPTLYMFVGPKQPATAPASAQAINPMEMLLASPPMPPTPEGT